MPDVVIDVWLYGTLSRYGGDGADSSFAHLEIGLPAGSTMGALLERLGLPTEERGLTFINGDLSALPGLQTDLDHLLAHQDRVGLFDLRSMWPCQYRHGAAMTEKMAQAISEDDQQGLHHSYASREDG